MSKVAAHFQRKNKTFIYSFRYLNKESGKILKNEIAEPLFRTLQNIYDGAFMLKHNG